MLGAQCFWENVASQTKFWYNHFYLLKSVAFFKKDRKLSKKMLTQRVLVTIHTIWKALRSNVFGLFLCRKILVYENYWTNSCVCGGKNRTHYISHSLLFKVPTWSEYVSHFFFLTRNIRDLCRKVFNLSYFWNSSTTPGNWEIETPRVTPL